MGLSYVSRTRARRRGDGIPELPVVSPTRLTASLVGWLTVLIFVLGVFNGGSHFAGTVGGIGIAVYILLRVPGGILEPIFLWLLSRRTSANEYDS